MMAFKLNKRDLFIITIFILITLCSFLYVFNNPLNRNNFVELLPYLEKVNVTKVHQLDGHKTIHNIPKFKYESVRRKVMQDVQEFWYFIDSKMTELKRNPRIDANILSTVNKVLSMGFEYKRTLVNNMEKLIDVDGFNNWRNSEITDLSNIVQKRLYYLQNPVDCKKAKKLVCSISYSCGFGCQMHYLIACMILAYGMERTLILQSSGWQYHKNGWEEIFKPLSNHCITVGNASIDKWPGTNKSKIILIPTSGGIYPRSQYMPLAVPEDLINRLKTIHGNPIVWWIGQILKYVWKPQNLTTTYINDKMKELKIKSPFVGVHIRRTDKLIKEAKYHAIEEYMTKVDEYYNLTEIKTNITKRRVYIATDDFNVITEAKIKYSHYEILYNPNIPRTPKNNSLHSNDSLLDVILDIHLLSHSDFLVCTFSSNICRLSYELMQNDYVDASTKFASLDYVYGYFQQKYNKRKVILSHKAQTLKEIDLLPGDIINIAYNYWNGYSSGTNLRTKQKGLYPTFKVDIESEIVKFPTYSKVDNK